MHSRRLALCLLLAAQSLQNEPEGLHKFDLNGQLLLGCLLCMLSKIKITCNEAEVSCISPLAKNSAAIVATWKYRQSS